MRQWMRDPLLRNLFKIVEFGNIWEACLHHAIEHLAYTSSSNGANKKMPLSANDNVDYPLSLYAATKKTNKLMAIYLYSLI